MSEWAQMSAWERLLDELRCVWINWLQITTVVLGSLAALVVGVVLVVNWLTEATCYQTGAQMERTVHYRLLSGCMVQTASGFIPLDNFRVIERKP